MSDKTTNGPAIRFKGFTDAWEQCKLMEVGEIVTGSTPPTSNADNYSSDGSPWITPTDIKSQTISDSPKKLSAQGESISRMVPAGTILVTSIASIGKNTMLTVRGSFNQQINGVVPNENNDSYFLLTMSEIWSKKMKSFASSGTMQIVNKTEFSKMKFEFPKSKREQTQIGQFFAKLDDLIALHQREYDKTVNIKKAMLEKMFPKDGEDKPEIRFDRFTDAWEQRKLGEVTDRVRGNDGRMDLPTLTMSAGNGWMNQIDRFSGNIAGKEQKNYTLLSKSELSYNHGNSKLAKYGVVFELKDYEEALVPRVYHSFKSNDKSVPLFLEYIFATKQPDRELGKLVSSGARMDGLLNINFDDFMGIKIKLPAIDEQKKISSFFKQLDDLIALHQHELELMKIIKKSLLKAMFV
ncbi:restriction endonuclease subunit S [Lactococcus insecticola]|uniref:Type I restriction endonuclease n=1 Tax=Pseudolactococcus insecticola TaxID=2709158 RepID=A0A6A0B3F7_9LACT|nr:restriction endonuclease subunit S [Lactococcus insecticola]GFH39672.1 type I restriction endonuclease [Lactococcus insecticola]